MNLLYDHYKSYGNAVDKELLKSGLTLHDFRRTTDQIGCDMSRQVIAGNRGK